MEDIVLKRTANITSAEALDEISDAYPEAEILSFRKIREAGSETDFFVARLKSAVMANEEDDIVLDNKDVVVEDKEHENREEEKMDKIVELLTEVLGELKNESESADEGLDDMQLEMEELPKSDAESTLPPEEDPYAKLPTDVKPPLGSGMISKIVVSRPATVSKKQARLELTREFVPQGYSIESIKKVDNKYLANLEKNSDAARRRQRIRKERDELAQREDRSMAPGTSQVEWQKFPYVKSERARSGYIQRLLKDLNNGQPWPRPTPPKGADKTPDSMRKFQQELARWEKAYETADAQLAVTSDMADYLWAHYNAISTDPNLNQDEIVDLSNKEYEKLKAMFSKEDRQNYYESQEDFLSAGIQREKELKQKEFRFPDRQLGERGEITPAGYQELLRKGDPSVKYNPPPKQYGMSLEEIEGDLLSQVSQQAYPGDRESAYDTLAKLKKMWQDPESFIAETHDQKIAEAQSSLQQLQSSNAPEEQISRAAETVKRLTEDRNKQLEYITRNADQNKRVYFDALAAVARLDPKEQGKYLRSEKYYAQMGPSPLPGRVPTGISMRTEAPGSIERQRNIWRPSPTPEIEEQRAGTPATQAADFMRWWKDRSRIEKLRGQQTAPEQEETVEEQP